MNRIKELRKARNMSQVVLANILGVTRSALSMWEIDKSQPDSDMLVRIADLFSVSTDYLLDHTVPAEPQKEKPVENDGLDMDEAKLLALFRQLNTEGRERLLENADDMVQSGKYIKSDASDVAAKEA